MLADQPELTDGHLALVDRNRPALPDFAKDWEDYAVLALVMAIAEAAAASRAQP
jgi:hypothetical protein